MIFFVPAQFLCGFYSSLTLKRKRPAYDFCSLIQMGFWKASRTKARGVNDLTFGSSLASGGRNDNKQRVISISEQVVRWDWEVPRDLSNREKPKMQKN